jgi:hypothetical protein
MYKEDVITAEECMNYLPLKITIFIRIISHCTQQKSIKLLLLLLSLGLQGRIQDFKLGGVALKKIAPSGGRHENVWGISCENSRFYAKKADYRISFLPCIYLYGNGLTVWPILVFKDSTTTTFSAIWG